MAAFPAALNDLHTAIGSSSTALSSGHVSQHTAVAADVEGLEVKVGIDGSAVTSTHDYKLAHRVATDATSTIADAVNIVLGTSTGTKIGTGATQKLGFYGATPIVQGGAYTQTYSTAARTVPNATVSAVDTTASTLTTPYGYAAQAQADAIPVAINALAADVLALKKVITALIDDQQALGFAT